LAQNVLKTYRPLSLTPLGRVQFLSIKFAGVRTVRISHLEGELCAGGTLYPPFWHPYGCACRKTSTFFGVQVTMHYATYFMAIVCSSCMRQTVKQIHFMPERCCKCKRNLLWQHPGWYFTPDSTSTTFPSLATKFYWPPNVLPSLQWVCISHL